MSGVAIAKGDGVGVEARRRGKLSVDHRRAIA
jgi:hypothetical protein